MGSEGKCPFLNQTDRGLPSSHTFFFTTAVSAKCTESPACGAHAYTKQYDFPCTRGDVRGSSTNGYFLPNASTKGMAEKPICTGDVESAGGRTYLRISLCMRNPSLMDSFNMFFKVKPATGTFPEDISFATPC